MHSPNLLRKSGMRRPTRDDVAREARVSGWTVSQVLNDKRNVTIAPETRSRVLAVAEALGYRPNPSARALVTGRTQIIGMWMCLDYSRYRSYVVHRMQQLLVQSDYGIAITDVEVELSRHRSLSRTVRLAVDGILSFDTPTAGAAFIRDHHPGDLPFVCMGAFWAEGCSFVGVDLYAGAVEAMHHLLASGRRRIAFLHLGAALPHEPRYEAYCHVMREAGLEPEFITTPDITLASARWRVREYLQTLPRPDAIFCLNDDLAFGVHRALCDLGLKIGEEIAIVGCDGLEETEYLACPLTTIQQPVDEMCALAWQFLQNHIQDPSAPLQQRILKPELVIRESTRR